MTAKADNQVFSLCGLLTNVFNITSLCTITGPLRTSHLASTKYTTGHDKPKGALNYSRFGSWVMWE